MHVAETTHKVVSDWIEKETELTNREIDLNEPYRAYGHNMAELAKRYAKCVGKLEAVLYQLSHNDNIGEEVTKIVLDNFKEV